MALYVDIEPIVKRLTSVVVTDDCFGLGIQMGINHAMEIIAKAPIVEAEPVVHAHWIPNQGCSDMYGVRVIFDCSNCGGQVSHHGYVCPDKRCKFCGAHMDEEVADA